MTMPLNLSKPTKTPVSRSWRGRRQGANWPAIGIILFAHAAGLFALMQVDAVREKVAEAAPIFVSFIAASPAPRPEPSTPKPPLVVKPQPVPQLIAHRSSAPAEVKAPLPDPPKESPPESAAAAPPAPASPALPPVTPPNFVAGYLDNPAPLYSPISRNLGESGQVLLRVLVDTEGHSKQIEIDRSSGFDRLDRAAIDAINKWRFVPAKRGTQAVEAWVLVPINFKLDS